MSISASEFLKWCQVFKVTTGGGGPPITLPLVMSQGGTGANITPVNHALFISNAVTGELLPTVALSLLGSDAAGIPIWSSTLPIGTMATSPASSPEVATKGYVDAVAAGLNPAESVYAASTANLTGYIYNNGASGVGATLTAGANGVFTIDGVSPPLNAPILYKNDTTGAGAFNGVYLLTTVGTAGTPAVLTRAPYYNTPTNMNNNGVIPVVNGTLNSQSGWLLTSIVVTVGTTPLVYIQFGQTVGIVPLTNGGTGNALTASNGGIVYSDATGLQILGGVAQARRMLQSGLSSAPSWSTSLWPATTTVNQILWSSAANAVTGLTTAASAVLSTSAGGVPSFSTTLPNINLGTPTGGVMTNTTGGGGLRSVQTITAGTLYTKPANVTSIFVEVQGAGGGGGGGAGGTGTLALGGSGGAGGYTAKWYPNAAATYPCAIGAPGTAGAPGANGGVGGTTTFDTLASTGGAGGGGGTATTGFINALGASGGTGTGGTLTKRAPRGAGR